MKSVYRVLILLMVIMACKKPYNPPAIKGNGSYLVVEGVINAGTDSTIIQLNKTVNVSSTVTTNPVTQAVVAVESDQNVSYPLTETINGNYVSAGLNLNVSRSYRLIIRASDNEQYASDFVPVTITPPIDSVGFNIINGPATGVQIYANTHDINNNTHYYRWDYQEAWEFHPKYPSNYITNGSQILLRQPSQNVSTCYTHDVSSNIVLGSSAKLKQDLIYQNPITFIASTSEKIEAEYSILLREYALTSEAYTFWINLKTNTEQLGSIFDAQPSQIPGNIHCTTNPSESVIGYLSVCTVSSKRIFISNAQLPNWIPDYPYTCQQDSFFYANPHNGYNEVAAFLVPLSSSSIPTSAFPNPFNVKGFLASTRECVDCTIRGSVTAPPFWK